MANEIELAQGGNNFSANGGNAVTHFFDTSTMDGKMALYNAMQTPDKVDDHLNEELDVTNVLAQAVEVMNNETGEMRQSTRVVVVAEQGNYAATSPTLAHAFGNLFTVFGTPNTWAEPLKLKIVERKSRNGYKFFDIQPVTAKKK